VSYSSVIESGICKRIFEEKSQVRIKSAGPDCERDNRFCPRLGTFFKCLKSHHSHSSRQFIISIKRWLPTDAPLSFQPLLSLGRRCRSKNPAKDFCYFTVDRLVRCSSRSRSVSGKWLVGPSRTSSRATSFFISLGKTRRCYGVFVVQRQMNRARGARVLER
jgi:hypothetical protein